MHILTIHFIFSVLSKCCFPSWVEKVFIKIYQESERKPINYLFAVQNGKISSFMLYFLLFNPSSPLFKNIHISSIGLSLLGRIRCIFNLK